MKKPKYERGITLLSLIISIIILLILSVIVIKMLTNYRIIGRAKWVIARHQIEEEKESIKLALNNWSIEKYALIGENKFVEFLKEKISIESEVKRFNEDQNTAIVTVIKSGNQYKVKSDGNIEEGGKLIKFVFEGTGTIKVEEEAISQSTEFYFELNKTINIQYARNKKEITNQEGEKEQIPVEAYLNGESINEETGKNITITENATYTVSFMTEKTLIYLSNNTVVVDGKSIVSRICK